MRKKKSLILILFLCMFNFALINFVEPFNATAATRGSGTPSLKKKNDEL